MIKLSFYEIPLSNREYGTMADPLKEIEINNKKMWITKPQEHDIIAQRVETAFNIALGKLLETKGNIETVMQTGEAFGRGIFADLIQEKPEEWTMQEWLESVITHIFNPMGHGFTITEISDNCIKSMMTRNPLHEKSSERNIVGLFTYGFTRGLFLSAFPKGELIMDNTTLTDDPLTEYTFKINPLHRDRLERERVKNFFITTKK